MIVPGVIHSKRLPASIDEASPVSKGLDFPEFWREEIGRSRRNLKVAAPGRMQMRFVSFLPLALNSRLTNDDVSWTSVGAATRQGLSTAPLPPTRIML